MSSGKDLTSGDVERIIQDDFEAENPGNHKWQVHGPAKAGRDCLLFRARTSRYDHDVAVKVFPADSLDTRTFRKQVGLLEEYCSRMQGQYCRVPAILGSLQDPNMVLMEWVSAPRITRSLLKRPFQDAGREHCLQTAGRWLRSFHEVKGLTVQDLDTRSPLARIESLIRGAGTQASSSYDWTFKKSLKELEKALEDLKGRPCPHARTHGDFTPNNIFHGREGTIGYDFFSRKRAPITDDICRFLVYAQVYRLFRLHFSSAGALNGLVRDWDTFLQGYGSRDPGLDRDTFKALFLAETLRRWASIQKQVRLGARGLWKKVEMGRLKKLARIVADTM